VTTQVQFIIVIIITIITSRMLWPLLDSYGLGKGYKDGSCEHINVLTGYIKFGEFVGL